MSGDAGLRLSVRSRHVALNYVLVCSIERWRAPVEQFTDCVYHELEWKRPAHVFVKGPGD